MPNYALIQFSQFESDTSEDDLLVFAAPAKEISQWAGIPRKGWRIRMLYQRWMTPLREKELVTFWNLAGQPNREAGEGFILGPTAITVAIQGTPNIIDGRLDLHYDQLVNLGENPIGNLQALAKAVRPNIVERLTAEQQIVVADFESDYKSDMPEVSHDYVLEFALQLTQMENDPEWFLEENAVEPEELSELLVSLEAISRPAIVVDGQHRLYGAAAADVPVWLPVVAMPNANWTEQIYQFVVINEKAQRVESSLLTDIFGSSLTREEQKQLRDKLARARVEIEPRIAATIANRDPKSPFYQMIRLRLQGDPPGNAKPYITDTTIRLLIDGSTRDSRGWRSDDEFYNAYVEPTIPDRPEWDSWSSGAWRQYWFTFWRTVADFYTAQAREDQKDAGYILWDPQQQTNLTKGVTLRLLQRLFMEKAIARIQEARSAEGILIEELGEEIAKQRIRQRIAKRALPKTPEEFATDITAWFLEKGVPVRVFTRPWKASLDDEQGRQDLYDELDKAFEAARAGKRYRAQNQLVFKVEDK